MSLLKATYLPTLIVFLLVCGFGISIRIRLLSERVNMQQLAPNQVFLLQEKSYSTQNLTVFSL